MKKKVIIAFCFCTLALTPFTGSVSQAQVTLPEVPSDLITTMVCRCKHGGCYGGSTISFRSACAKSTSGTIDCNAYTSNCPS